jgi:hypothetical protein
MTKKQLELLDDLLMAGSWSNHQLTLIAVMRIDVLAEVSLKDSLEEFHQANKEAASLPPLVPIKVPEVLDANGKRVASNSPLNVKCPRCGAERGDLCFELSARGIHGVPTKKRRKSGQYHSQRSKLARSEG